MASAFMRSKNISATRLVPAKHVNMRADARLIGKMLRVDIEQDYRNFRKFSSDSKLIVGAQ